MNTLFITAFAVGGFVVIWRKYKKRHARVRRMIEVLPYPLSGAIRCTSCFTYWLSLLAVLLVDPFKNVSIATRFAVSNTTREIILILIAWMATAMVATLLRYVAVLLSGVIKDYLPHEHSHTQPHEH